MSEGRREPSFTDSLTAGGYKFGSAIAQLTPGPISQGLANVAGAAMAPTMRAKRSMIERHLRRVDPSLGPFAVRRKAQQAFESYSRYWVESFRLPNLSKQTVDRTFTYTGYHEHLLPALDAGNGCIIALPHLGGWEWAGRWIADRGHPITVVVEPLENRELFEWFVDLRAKLGMTVVPLGPDAGAAVLKALRNNEVVCLLSDRDLTRDGVSVEFFGEHTTLPPGPATLSLRTGAPILPTGVYFTKAYNGHHTIVRAPVPAEREGRLRDDVTRVTQLLAHELEWLIRRAPEQWHLFQPNWPSDPGYGV